MLAYTYYTEPSCHPINRNTYIRTYIHTYIHTVYRWKLLEEHIRTHCLGHIHDDVDPEVHVQAAEVELGGPIQGLYVGRAQQFRSDVIEVVHQQRRQLVNLMNRVFQITAN